LQPRAEPRRSPTDRWSRPDSLSSWSANQALGAALFDENVIEGRTCGSALLLTSNRRPRLTPPSAPYVPQRTLEFNHSLGSMLDAERGQNSEPRHTQRRPSLAEPMLPLLP